MLNSSTELKDICEDRLRHLEESSKMSTNNEVRGFRIRDIGAKKVSFSSTLTSCIFSTVCYLGSRKFM